MPLQNRVTPLGELVSDPGRGLVYGNRGCLHDDTQLHTERLVAHTSAQRHHDAPLDDLPDGTFVLHGGAPHLVLGAGLLSWTAAGYTTRTPRPRGQHAVLITPPSLVAVLRAGWQPQVPLFHPSASPGQSSSYMGI